MEITHGFVLLCTVTISNSLLTSATADTPYKEFYFEQKIDHFNSYWKNYGKEVFMQRYLVQGTRRSSVSVRDRVGVGLD